MDNYNDKPLENVKVAIPDANKQDLLKLDIFITVENGLYRCIQCQFEINFSIRYPFEAPKVFCITKIYHPNIVFDYSAQHPLGRVMTPVLLQDWIPVLSLDAILLTLMLLLTVKLYNCPFFIGNTLTNIYAFDHNISTI